MSITTLQSRRRIRREAAKLRAEVSAYAASHPTMTYSKIAEHFGIGVRTVGRWLTGRHRKRGRPRNYYREPCVAFAAEHPDVPLDEVGKKFGVNMGTVKRWIYEAQMNSDDEAELRDLVQAVADDLAKDFETPLVVHAARFGVEHRRMLGWVIASGYSPSQWRHGSCTKIGAIADTKLSDDAVYRTVREEHPAGATLEEIAAAYGITRERVRQIEAAAIAKLSGHRKLATFVEGA